MITINFIVTWAHGVIVAVIIASIIEMILPESNNSKYIKIVIGIFILFTVVSPVINKFKGNSIQYKKSKTFLNMAEPETLQASSGIDNSSMVKKMYEDNLKVDIKAKIMQKGYVVGEINLNILDNEEFTLSAINVNIIGTNQVVNNAQKTATIVENVETVLVNVSGDKAKKENQNKSVISESEKKRLAQYLSGVYEVRESNIHIY